MSSPVRVAPITMTRGQDFPLVVTVYTPDTVTDGVVVRSVTPQNISGHTYVLTVSRTKDSTDKLITKTFSTLVAASGTMRTTVAEADSINLAPRTYHYDIWRSDSGSREPIVEGPWTIKGNARNPA